jgi:chromosome transmission fidelity protein 1
MSQYHEKALTINGAIIFCKNRGKLSEGINFKDNLCRSVIMLGIPYPPPNDIFLNQKTNYLKGTSM